MNIDMKWLGDEFPADTDKQGLFTRVGPDGQVLSFGFRGFSETTEVDVAKLTATVTRVRSWKSDSEEGDPAEPEEWLESWKTSVLAEANPTFPSPTCSFCGKTNHEVKKLIAGPSCYICDECIGLCNDIIESEKDFAASPPPDEPT